MFSCFRFKAVRDYSMAESYQELYKDTLEATNEYGSKLRDRYENLTETIRAMCAKYSQFLVLPAEKFQDPALSLPTDDFVLTITQLLRHKEVTERLLLHKLRPVEHAAAGKKQRSCHARASGQATLRSNCPMCPVKAVMHCIFSTYDKPCVL